MLGIVAAFFAGMLSTLAMLGLALLSDRAVRWLRLYDEEDCHSEVPSVPAPRRPAAHFGDPPPVAAPVLVLLINAAVARVFQAAKRAGMAVRVDLVRGTADVIPADDVPKIEGEAQERPVEPKRVIVL